MFANVLIANRGEIACRIIATAKRLGLEAIALHTPADRGARFTRLADRVVEVPSYLDAQAIVAAAKAAGAECLHPGYGFLSENADFAEYCAIEDIVFVGPPPEAMRAMGLKSSAKAVVARTGAPVVPGYYGENQTAKFMRERAYQLGYPVLIKAIAGGGGRGIRRVDSHIEFEAALESAQREAEASFGDGRVLIEKFIASPRHIEVQVFGDTHGNVVHLYERDCSLQRRHQKIWEEANSPALNVEQRMKIGEICAAAMRKLKYRGAGTVEFLYENGEFFFIEMNTRLQVEHPITEAITGIDLVNEQIRVAAGAGLSVTQADIVFSGHAIECRINAEDPRTFVPSPGTITHFHAPGGLGVRVDSGAYQGYKIPPYYDSLIGKLIVHGRTRVECMMRLRRVLDEFVIDGIKTTLPLFQDLVTNPDIANGDYDIHWLEEYLAKTAV